MFSVTLVACVKKLLDLKMLWVFTWLECIRNKIISSLIASSLTVFLISASLHNINFSMFQAWLKPLLMCLTPALNVWCVKKHSPTCRMLEDMLGPCIYIVVQKLLLNVKSANNLLQSWDLLMTTWELNTMFTRKENITQILEEETINSMYDIKHVLNQIYMFYIII